MDVQNGAGEPFEHLQNGTGDAMSPDSSAKPKLQLPVSCDPPSPGNPAKQMVWIVSTYVSEGNLPEKKRKDNPHGVAKIGGLYALGDNTLTTSSDLWQYGPHGSIPRPLLSQPRRFRRRCWAYLRKHR